MNEADNPKGPNEKWCAVKEYWNSSSTPPPSRHNPLTKFFCFIVTFCDQTTAGFYTNKRREFTL